MALQIDITFPTGVELPQAYCKVVEVFFRLQSNSYTDTTCVFSVEVYKDKTARDNNMAPVNIETYTLSGTDYTTYFDYAVLNEQDKNPTAQAYTYLKTLPQYANAIDV